MKQRVVQVSTGTSRPLIRWKEGRGCTFREHRGHGTRTGWACQLRYSIVLARRATAPRLGVPKWEGHGDERHGGSRATTAMRQVPPTTRTFGFNALNGWIKVCA